MGKKLVTNSQLDTTNESQEVNPFPAGQPFRIIPNVVEFKTQMGAQWLSGRGLDSRPKGRGFEPHRGH